MSEHDTSEAEISPRMRRRLQELRVALLKLHKVLLEEERVLYEKVYGQVHGYELLQLVLNHEQFAWLHPLSQLVVRIDVVLESEEPAGAEAREVCVQARVLLSPAPEKGAFQRRYHECFQSSPAVVLAHSEVMHTLTTNGAV